MHHASREERPGQVECSAYSCWLLTQHLADYLPAVGNVSDEAVRVAVGLRLGTNILCELQACACGASVSAKEITVCPIRWFLSEWHATGP